MAAKYGSSMATDLTVDWFKLTWTNTDLLDRLADGDKKVNDAVMAVLERKAPDVEAHMKINAPWTDQTGNARSGLRAEAYDLGDEQKGIILYHQVPYGIWLEVKYSGKYAIINPTIEVMGPEVMAALESLLDGINF
jgi:hypothetical protein